MELLIRTVTEEFGYRSFSFDAKSGFTINGEQMKLCGGCVKVMNCVLKTTNCVFKTRTFVFKMMIFAGVCTTTTARSARRRSPVLRSGAWSCSRRTVRRCCLLCIYLPAIDRPLAVDAVCFVYTCRRLVDLSLIAGYNAIRTSHNPVSRAFVAACDKLGVMLMEEAFDCWSGGKNVDDYNRHFDDWWQRDVESMVFRDRNAPSIIMWSIGNEIPDAQIPGRNRAVKTDQ